MANLTDDNLLYFLFFPRKETGSTPFLCAYNALASNNLTRHLAHPGVRRVVTDSVCYIAMSDR